MQLFLIALFTFVLIMALMAVGVLMGRKPIAGSCGGVGAALGEKDYECPLCGDDPNKCESVRQDEKGQQADWYQVK